jgi:hypothetical protein
VAKKILEEINVPWVTILSQVRAVLWRFTTYQPSV